MTAVQKIEFHSMFSAMDIWKKLPEGIRAEVIDNKLYILASPTPYHQETLATLYSDLRGFVTEFNLGKVWLSPVDLFLEEQQKSAVVPDLIFIATDNKTRVERNGLFGVPDLLIEILSSNKTHDLVTKKRLYERTGVKEYWIVNPDTKDATGFILEEGAYGNPLLMNSKINVRALNKEFSF